MVQQLSNVCDIPTCDKPRLRICFAFICKQKGSTETLPSRRVNDEVSTAWTSHAAIVNYLAVRWSRNDGLHVRMWLLCTTWT